MEAWWERGRKKECEKSVSVVTDFASQAEMAQPGTNSKAEAGLMNESECECECMSERERERERDTK